MAYFKTPLLLFLLWVLILGLSVQYPIRYDSTQDQRYSLSPLAIDQLDKLDSTLRIDVFLTGELPASYRQFEKEVRVFLNQIQRHNKEVILSFNDPFALGDEETVISEMQRYGMTPERVFEMQDGTRKESVVFPWIIVNYGQRSERIPLIERQLGDTEEAVLQKGLQQLEYHLFDGIHKVSVENKSNIAFLTSHKTSESLLIADLLQSLKPYYNLASFDLKNPTLSPQNTLENLMRFPLLVISNPKEAFTSTEKYILDQYELQGGHLLWLVNGIEIDREQLFTSSGTSYGLPLELELDDYFFQRGVRINKRMVKDLYCAPIVLANGEENQTQFIPYPWPYFPLSKPENTPLGNDLGPVLGQFVSPIDTLTNALQKTILLTTSAFTQSIGPPVIIEIEEATKDIVPAQYNESASILGVGVQGPSSSLFKNKIKPFEIKNHRNEGTVNSVYFSDGNLAENQTDKGNYLPLGYDKWTSNEYANKTFLMNVIHKLSNASQRIELRQKKWVLIPYDPLRISANAQSLKWILLFVPTLLGLLLGGLIYWQRSKHFGG